MKVALYVRVSTDEQAEQGYSIPAQTEVLEQYAARCGWENAGVYADEGYTAKNTKRPALQRMLRDISQGHIQAVLVWRANRLTRRLRDLTSLLEFFHRHGVTLVSITERFDESTAMGRAMIQIAGVFAELERNNLAENVLLGQRKKARKGGWNGGRVYGYDNSPEGLVINPLEGAVVRRIYDQWVAGHGARSIATTLNREGIRTKQGNEWTLSNVIAIIDSPLYKGYVRYGVMNDWGEKRRKGKQENPILARGTHEAIVDEETWEKAQTIRRMRPSRPTRHQGHYLLSGLVRCPQCGDRMVGWHTFRNGRVYRYYKCSTFNSKGNASCRGNYVNAGQAEQVVLERLGRVLQHRDVLDEILDRLQRQRQEQSGPLEGELAAVEQGLARLKERIRNLVEAVENKTLPEDVVRERMAELKEQQAGLQQRKAAVEQQLAEAKGPEVSRDEVWDALQRFQAAFGKSEPDTQKRLLAALIDRITVTKERVVDQVHLAFDPLSLCADLMSSDPAPWPESLYASSVTFNGDTALPG